MKMWRMAGAGIAATALMTVAACGGGGNTGESSGGDGGNMMSSGPSSSMSSSSSMNKASGVTSKDDVYGPACGKVPKSGSGSVGGMIDDPVATAASNNPLLEKLTASVKAAGLADTLNSQEGITVFAPYDKAFKDLGKDKVQTLLNEKTDKLASILKYHVVPKRMDAETISSMDSIKTLNGAELAIEGSGQDFTVNGDKVLCGNIPTANATVFVVDKVMTPPKS